MGLKFSIPGFFGVGKFGKYFFGWFDLSWQTHHHFGSGRRWLSKMHVDKYVLGKGFGCTGTLTDDIYMDSHVNP